MSKLKRSPFFGDFEDDGRTVADMDLPGMPWNDAAVKPFRNRARILEPRNDRHNTPEMPPLSRRETFSLVANALLAGLTLAAVFMGAILLFILFCVFVWFR